MTTKYGESLLKMDLFGELLKACFQDLKKPRTVMKFCTIFEVLPMGVIFLTPKRVQISSNA